MVIIMQRNEKVFIKITKLTSDLLQIEPVVSKYHGSDLSIELSILKQQLMEYGLKPDVDFTINHGPYPSTSPEYKIEFKEKSRVVRGLYGIPADFFRFLDYGNCTNKESLENYKCIFALSLTPKDCFYSEITCVQQAQSAKYAELVKDIFDLHNLYPKANSLVINQLSKEIQFLSKRQDTLFENTNLALLVSALYNASCEEKSLPTVVSDSFSLFKKESKILAAYEKLIRKYAPFVSGLFKSQPYASTSEPDVAKMKACYQKMNQENTSLAQNKYVG